MMAPPNMGFLGTQSMHGAISGSTISLYKKQEL